MRIRELLAAALRLNAVPPGVNVNAVVTTWERVSASLLLALLLLNVSSPWLGRYRRSLDAAVVGLGVLALWVGGLSIDMMAEDAFISLRYADQFAHGNGLVFNVGERVEGYSCFLWVLGLSVFQALGVAGMVTLRVQSLLAATLCVAVVARTAGSAAKRPVLASSAAVLALVASPSFQSWSVAGMEHQLLGGLLAAGAWAIHRERFVLAGVLSLACLLLRFDAFLLVTPIAVVALLQAFPAPNPEAKRTRLLTLLGVASAFAAWHLWRYAYYGDVLPNTYYAKRDKPEVLALSGLSYLSTFVGNNWVIIGLAGIGFGRFLTPSLTAIGISTFVTLGSSLLSGGDWMPMHRLLQTAMPLLAVLVGVAVDAMPLPARGRSRVREVATATAAFAALALSAGAQSISWRFELRGQVEQIWSWSQAQSGLREIGLLMKRALPERTKVVLGAIGACAYHAGGKLVMVDALGLTEPRVAKAKKLESGWVGHRSSNWPYILSIRADVLLITGNGYGNRDLGVPDDSFAPAYRQYCQKVQTQNTLGDTVCFFLRNDVYEQHSAALTKAAEELPFAARHM